MSADLQNPIFHDETAAREALEAARWPNGPVCPHCNNSDPEKLAKLATKSVRPGLFYCNECKGQFTVTVGSVFERSKVPLTKWWLATYLLSSSKKGMSAHQIHRTLGVTYKTAWFMCHRIREAMSNKSQGPLGGDNMVVEIDETYVGGKAKNRAFRKPADKKAVVSLVQRDGRAMSFHVANVTAKTLRPLIVKNASRASAIMTDDSAVYPKVGTEFANHHAVNHSADEYARLGGYVHTNTAENFFSILKRGITGVYHSVSEAHLHRYLAEFDFRYNNRTGLGVNDSTRTDKAMAGIGGKRITYRRTREAAHA